MRFGKMVLEVNQMEDYFCVTCDKELHRRFAVGCARRGHQVNETDAYRKKIEALPKQNLSPEAKLAMDKATKRLNEIMRKALG